MYNICDRYYLNIVQLYNTKDKSQQTRNKLNILNLAILLKMVAVATWAG